MLASNNKYNKYAVPRGRKFFFLLLCSKSILALDDKWHLWQVSLLLVLELLVRNKFKLVCLDMDVIICFWVKFFSLCWWVVWFCMLLCFIWDTWTPSSGQGLTKAVADLCLTWQVFSKRVHVIKRHLNKTGIQPSYVPNCIFLFQWVVFSCVYWEIQRHQVKHQAEKELQIDSCF